MNGLRAVVLALLVSLGTVGGAALGATQQGADRPMSVQSAENTSNYLGPNDEDVERSGQAATELDVAATVSVNAGQVRSTFTQVSLERKYGNAESPEENRSVVRNGTDQLAQRVDALEQREREAIDQYARGEIAEGDLFRILSGIDAEATERIESAKWLESRADENDMSDTAARLSALRIRLTPLAGPVRDNITAGLDGETTSRFYVETAGDGLVLATTTRRANGEYVYVRETYSSEMRDLNGQDRYAENYSELVSRLEEIYPWTTATENTRGFGSLVILGTSDARLYSLEFSHRHGQLKPYVSGGSGEVVREIQRKQVDEVPTDSLNRTSDDGELRVLLDTTYAGGPFGVTAYDNGTGQPVNASVAVDGHSIGSTGEERLWTVAPRGQTNVTVVHEGTVVSVRTAQS